MSLHTKTNRIDLDPTFSLGKFYDNTGIEVPKYKYDINPQLDYVEYGDCRKLPLPDNIIDVEILDPPFLATSGKSLKSTDDNNIIAKRFGVYSSEHDLHKLYIDSLKEAYRILNDGGILIFKCQDKVSSGKQYFSHCFIYEEAIKLGFYPKDLFILLAKSRISAEWQAKNQKNARKYHAYFWVFEKSNKKIAYV